MRNRMVIKERRDINSLNQFASRGIGTDVTGNDTREITRFFQPPAEVHDRVEGDVWRPLFSPILKSNAEFPGHVHHSH